MMTANQLCQAKTASLLETEFIWFQYAKWNQIPHIGLCTTTRKHKTLMPSAHTVEICNITQHIIQYSVGITRMSKMRISVIVFGSTEED